MKKKLFFLSVTITGLLYAQNFPSIQTQEQIQAELDFLTASSDEVGFTYQGSIGELAGLTLPLSYYSTADYWEKYVGTLPGNNLTVVDAYNSQDYTLTPTLTLLEKICKSKGSMCAVEQISTMPLAGKSHWEFVPRPA